MVSSPLPPTRQRSIPAIIQGQYGKQDDDGMDGTKYANITTFSAALAAKNKQNGLKEIAPRGGKKTACKQQTNVRSVKQTPSSPPHLNPFSGGITSVGNFTLIDA